MLSVSLVPMRNCLVVFLVIVTKFCFTFVDPVGDPVWEIPWPYGRSRGINALQPSY